MVSPRFLSFAAILLTASTISARANDEIQVYNAEIAKIGQWTFQLHSNYAFIGRKEPDFPGGLFRGIVIAGKVGHLGLALLWQNYSRAEPW